MGHSMTPSVITIFGTCIVRIGWAYAVLKYSLGYVNLLMAYPVTWVITGTGVVTAYFIVRKREYGKKSSSI